MGNGESKSEYGGLVVHTDQPYSISGEMVTGNIYVQLEKPFPADELRIKLKGKEKCKWYEPKQRTEGEGENMKVIHYEDKYDEDETIMKFEKTLYSFDSEFLPAGQYTFPFAFKIPAD
jgi:hypothetical protein